MGSSDPKILRFVVMKRQDALKIATTLYRVSAFSWVLFVAVELLRPTTVTRLFSPHVFLATFFVGVWWYYFARKGTKSATT